MALTKVIGEGVGSLGTSSLTHGSDSGDTRFTLNSANQYTMVIKKAGDIAGQIGGGGADVLRVSNAAGATIMEMNAGQITKPLQPAFLVNKGGTAQSNFSRNSNVTVTFGTEVYDVGANFASNTFTAPVTGKYVLHAKVRMSEIDSDATYYTINIVTSNRLYTSIYDPRGYDQDPVNFSFNESAVADMDANDTATVMVYQAVGTDGHASISGNSTTTLFGGYLLG